MHSVQVELVLPNNGKDAFIKRHGSCPGPMILQFWINFYIKLVAYVQKKPIICLCLKYDKYFSNKHFDL